MGVKDASVAQIEQQIAYNDAELRGKLDFLSQCPKHQLSVPYRNRCQILRNSILNCLREYRIRTGKSFPYAVPMLPLRITVNTQLLKRSQDKATKKQNRQALQTLIDLGNRGRAQLSSRVSGQHKTAFNSGFANLIFSDWCRIFGGANPRMLKVLLTITLPNIKKLLTQAQTAVDADQFREAHSYLSQAAAEMSRAHGIVDRWHQKVESGAQQAELAIKFYAAVAAGGAASAYNAVNAGNLVSAAELTLGEKAAVGLIGEGTKQMVDLSTKSINENVTAKEFAAAAFDVGLAGATPLGEELLGKLLVRIAPQLATRMATQAVDRYLGRTGATTPIARQKMIDSVAKDLLGKIQAVGMNAFKKAVGQVTNFPAEPSWNFWENLFSPIVGGKLGPVLEAAARESGAYKAKVPN